MATLARRCSALGLVAGLAAATPSCTLAKPMVGAFTGPVVALGNSSGSFGCGCGDGRGVVVVLGAMAIAGAACGLVTGIISDVQALSGNCSDPCENWWDPFATN
jgi:ammonia channel protein AmtB